MRKSLTRIAIRRVGYRSVLPAAAILAFALSPTATAIAGSGDIERDDRRTISVQTENRIFVKNTRGKTIILGRKETDKVTIRTHKVVRARNAKTAAEWMDELDFDVDSDGEELSIVTRHPERAGEDQSFWSFLFGVRHRARIDYTIEVPGAFAAKVTSTSGNVQVTSLEGTVTVFGSSGDVFLSRIGGAAFVEISSGDAEVNDIDSDLRIRLSSGDVSVRGVVGSVAIEGTSGDVEVYDIGGDAQIELSSGNAIINGCRGNIELKTVSGDGRIEAVEGGVKAMANNGELALSVRPVGAKEYVLRTSSGDIDVEFEDVDGDGFVVAVTTSNGSIEGQLDIELDKISRRTLRGVVGRGEGRLNIETASGDIRIREMGK